VKPASLMSMGIFDDFGMSDARNLSDAHRTQAALGHENKTLCSFFFPGWGQT
jgi:hypothetical protein